MANKKKQHYVPRCLLKRFSDNEGKLYIFQLIKNNINPRPVPYNQQCYTNYMYGKDDTWENALAFYETSTSPILDSIEQSKIITSNDENILKGFVLFQRLRTEQAIDLNQNLFEEMVSKIMAMTTQMNDIQVTPYEISMYAQRYVQENSPRHEIATKNLEFAKDYNNILNDLKLLIVQTTHKDFICSDNPVIIENLFLPHTGLGFDCVGIIIFMPISPKYAVLIYDSKVYSLDKMAVNNIIDISCEDVNQFNRLLFLHAKDLLFSNSQKNLVELKNYFDSKYIDKPLKDIYLSFGIKDPIIINMEIAKIKKYNLALIDATIPKLFAKRENETFPLLKLNNEFKPYIDNINANFGRHDTLEKLEFKMQCWDKTYCELVRKYLSK